MVPLIEADPAAFGILLDALARARAYGAGHSTAADQIRRRMDAVRAAGATTTPAGAAAARAVAQAAAIAHMGAHALGAAAYATKAVSLSVHGSADSVEAEIGWQVAQLTGDQAAALRRLPALGSDACGPLGSGLMTRGILGATILELQARIRRGN